MSLHAPNNALRNELVPINKMHPIEDLLDACWRYAEKRANRFITFEYVMLQGVNDSTAHADELCELLDGKPAKVNSDPLQSVCWQRFRALGERDDTAVPEPAQGTRSGGDHTQDAR